MAKSVRYDCDAATGGVVEWLMAPVLKTGRAQALVGSNPTPSARLATWNRAKKVLTGRYMAAKTKLLRMDNVLIVVHDLEAAKAFFAELGMELEGEAPGEGRWGERVVGLNDVRADVD